MTPLVSSDLQLVLRVVVAAALGLAIGVQRSRHGAAAGSRTFALVATGSALYISIAGLFGDSSNIPGNIVTGIGFLGAGVVWKSGGQIRGLTTAAGVWTVAAIGTLVGLQHYIAAVAAALVVLVIFELGHVGYLRRHVATLTGEADDEAESD